MRRCTPSRLRLKSTHVIGVRPNGRALRPARRNRASETLRRYIISATDPLDKPADVNQGQFDFKPGAKYRLLCSTHIIRYSVLGSYAI